MNTRPLTTLSADERTAVERAVVARQVQIQRDGMTTTNIGVLFGAAILCAMLWQSVPFKWLLTWFSAVVVVIVLRTLALGRARAHTAEAEDRAWMLRFRVGLVVHGMTWAAAILLPIAADDTAHQSILLMVLFGITAISFMLNAFDVWSALCFGLPVMLLMCLRLAQRNEPVFWLLDLGIALALGFMALVARREHGATYRYEALRLAESMQSQALAEQHRLLALLMQGTSEGFWFMDADAVTTDVNPAMCKILGRPREAVIGHSLFDFVDADNEKIFRAQIDERREGRVGSYELSFSRPDGSQVECVCHATPMRDEAGRFTGSIGMWNEIGERKRAERHLRATTEELAQKTLSLQLTLDSIDQGILGIDAGGRVRVHNRRAIELLDLPAELIGPQTTFDDIVQFQAGHGELNEDSSFDDVEGRHHQPRVPGSGPPDLYTRRTRAGRLLEVRTRWLPDGGLVRTFADVTARIAAQHALEASEAELRALLDAFPGFIAVMDPAFVYTYANARFAALVNRPRDAVVGQRAVDILGAERFERVHGLVAAGRPGDQVTAESEYPATDHRPLTWLQVTHAIGVADSMGRRKVYAFGIDISARKEAEAALIAARDEAERANRAKSQFLSSMSHELRTPMNAILGFGQLLAADAEHPLAERSMGHVREILRGGRHLLELINEVLDLALVETGKLRISFEPVRITELLSECMALLRPLADTRGIALLLVDDAADDHDAAAAHALVHADRTRLKQVLLNLVSNAIKYNRAAGQVTIKHRALAGSVRISISDTGPGLAPEQSERLFQPFERLDAASTRVEGAGLGLVLSKRLIDAMQGRIGVSSALGEGSTFWIELPLARAPAFGLGAPLPRALAWRAEDAARVRRVLYVEDNPVNVLLMEAMLASLPGIRLSSAALPEIGLQMAAAQRPDLILLDIQLPGIDGFEVLRRLRQGDATRAIPVIAVSANAMASDVERGLTAGFAAYLTKPLDMDKLLQTIAATLAQTPPAKAD